MSLDYTQTPDYHYSLAKELFVLRQKGVLIIGSGNIIHNLREAAWHRINESFAYDWAIEADQKIKNAIQNDAHQTLIFYQQQGKAINLAAPSPDHFLPLLYTLALKQKNEPLHFFNDAYLAGSLSMTSLKIG